MVAGRRFGPGFEAGRRERAGDLGAEAVGERGWLPKGRASDFPRRAASEEKSSKKLKAFLKNLLTIWKRIHILKVQYGFSPLLSDI